MCLINITCDFSRLGFSGVSRSVNTITIYQSTHTCYSLFQTCACISLVTGRFKRTAWRVRVFISNISFATLRTWLQCQRYAAILGDQKRTLCMAFLINTYLYILFNYCLTENLGPVTPLLSQLTYPHCSWTCLALLSE